MATPKPVSDKAFELVDMARVGADEQLLPIMREIDPAKPGEPTYFAATLRELNRMKASTEAAKQAEQAEYDGRAGTAPTAARRRELATQHEAAEAFHGTNHAETWKAIQALDAANHKIGTGEARATDYPHISTMAPAVVAASQRPGFIRDGQPQGFTALQRPKQQARFPASLDTLGCH